MALLTCQNLTLSYGEKTILEDVNFSVSEGDYLCIVGENGSGKSTLMKTILGLRRPNKGAILTGDGLKKNEIGYLPQQTVVQKDFPASVWEVVLSGTLNHNGIRFFYNASEKKEAMKNMERLGIADLKSACYRDLSGGQQQRVLLARALCATHKLLLLDEPVAGLDPKVTEDMYELIARLNREGVTIIMVSHDMQAALHYATHMIEVTHASIYWGTTEDYLQSERGSRWQK